MPKPGKNRAKTTVGRPPSWRHQPTDTLRVPVKFHPILLDIARKLDQGSTEPIVIEPEKQRVDQQLKRNQAVLSGPRVYRHAGHKAIRVQELIDALQQLMQMD